MAQQDDDKELDELLKLLRADEAALREQAAIAKERSYLGHVTTAPRSVAAGFTGALGSGIEGIETVLRAPDRPKGWLSDIGQGIAGAIQPNPKYADTAAQQVLQGLGSTGAFVGAGALGGPGAVAALGVGAGVTEAEQRLQDWARQNPEQAKAKGLDTPAAQAEFAGRYGIGPGLLELLPAETILRKLPGGASASKHLARRMAEAGVSEAAAEGGAAVLQNDIAMLYDDSVTSVLQGAGEQAAIGAGSGALLELLMWPFRKRAAEVKGEEPPPPEPLIGQYESGENRPRPGLPPGSGTRGGRTFDQAGPDVIYGEGPIWQQPAGYIGPSDAAIDSIIEKYGDGEAGQQAWLDWVGVLGDAGRVSPQLGAAVRAMLEQDPNLSRWTRGQYQPGTDDVTGLLDQIIQTPESQALLDYIIDRDAAAPDYTTMLDMMIERAQEQGILSVDTPLNMQVTPEQRQQIGTELAKAEMRREMDARLQELRVKRDRMQGTDPLSRAIEQTGLVEQARAEAAQAGGDALDQAVMSSTAIADRADRAVAAARAALAARNVVPPNDRRGPPPAPPAAPAGGGAGIAPAAAPAGSVTAPTVEPIEGEPRGLLAQRRQAVQDMASTIGRYPDTAAFAQAVASGAEPEVSNARIQSWYDAATGGKGELTNWRDQLGALDRRMAELRPNSGRTQP